MARKKNLEGKGTEFGRREDVWQAELAASFVALWLMGRWSMPCQPREGVSEAVVAGAAPTRLLTFLAVDCPRMNNQVFLFLLGSCCIESPTGNKPAEFSLSVSLAMLGYYDIVIITRRYSR